MLCQSPGRGQTMKNRTKAIKQRTHSRKKDTESRDSQEVELIGLVNQLTLKREDIKNNFEENWVDACDIN